MHKYRRVRNSQKTEKGWGKKKALSSIHLVKCES